MQNCPRNGPRGRAPRTSRRIRPNPAAWGGVSASRAADPPLAAARSALAAEIGVARRRSRARRGDRRTFGPDRAIATGNRVHCAEIGASPSRQPRLAPRSPYRRRDRRARRADWRQSAKAGAHWSESAAPAPEIACIRARGNRISRRRPPGDGDWRRGTSVGVPIAPQCARAARKRRKVAASAADRPPRPRAGQRPKRSDQAAESASPGGAASGPAAACRRSVRPANDG